MPDPTIQLEPFSKQFICPICGFLDWGSYCSNCGHELRIPRDKILNELAKRLEMLEFRPFEEWLVTNEEVASYHDLAYWSINFKGKILYKEDQPDNGLKLQLVFLADQEVSGEAELKALIDEYTRNRAIAIARVNALPRKKRQRVSKYFLESIRIHGIIIKDIPEVKGNIGQITWMTRIRTKTGVRAGLLKKILFLSHIIRSSFLLKIKTDIAILDYSDGRLYTVSKGLYDIVRHQAEIIASQTKDFKTLIGPKATPKIVEAVYAVIDAFRDYFKILAQYIQNPGFFPNLIAMGNVIPLKKILALYFTGLVCSITLPWLLTGGYLTASKLGLFPNLPPFLADMGELLVDLLRISITCIILHIIMRMFGKKGRLATLLLCFLFYESFFQILERPLRYVTGPLLLSAFNQNYRLQYSVQILAFGSLWFVAAYFIFPILFAVYGATRKMIGVAYLIVAFIFGFFIGFATSFITAFNQARYGAELDYRNLQIFYRGAVTKEDAVRLKDYLAGNGYVTGQRQSTQLEKDDSGYVFRVVIRSGFQFDSSMRDLFRQMAVSISYKVFNGVETRIEGCDAFFKTVEVFRMPPGSRLTISADSNYIISYPESWIFARGGPGKPVFLIYSPDSSSKFNLLTEDIADTTIGLDAYVNALESGLKKKYKAKAAILEDTSETHADKPCRKLIFTLISQSAMSKKRVEQYVWVVRQKAFILSFVTDADLLDDDNMTVAELIMNSFSFVN